MKKVYVIGGANIDIQGVPSRHLIPKDSNPGKVSYAFGGVGRNIAENLSRLKHHVVFVSAIGQDYFGQALKQHCLDLKMDLSLSIFPEENSSTYLALLDEHHDMAWALCDMDILKHLDQKHLEIVLHQITSEDVLVVDTNLDEGILEYIVTHCKAKICVDPISSQKAHKIVNLLQHVYLFKPNQIEAETISGISLNTMEDYRCCLDYFLSQGVFEIVISLGKNGVIAATPHQKLWIKHSFVPMANATGAGDSFLAGLVSQLLQQKDLSQQLQYAIACATITVQSNSTVAPNITPELIADQIKEIEYVIQQL